MSDSTLDSFGVSRGRCRCGYCDGFCNGDQIGTDTCTLCNCPSNNHRRQVLPAVSQQGLSHGQRGNILNQPQHVFIPESHRKETKAINLLSVQHDNVKQEVDTSNNSETCYTSNGMRLRFNRVRKSDTDLNYNTATSRKMNLSSTTETNLVEPAVRVSSNETVDKQPAKFHNKPSVARTKINRKEKLHVGQSFDDPSKLTPNQLPNNHAQPYEEREQNVQKDCCDKSLDIVQPVLKRAHEAGISTTTTNYQHGLSKALADLESVTILERSAQCRAKHRRAVCCNELEYIVHCETAIVKCLKLFDTIQCLNWDMRAKWDGNLLQMFTETLQQAVRLLYETWSIAHNPQHGTLSVAIYPPLQHAIAQLQVLFGDFTEVRADWSTASHKYITLPKGLRVPSKAFKKRFNRGIKKTKDTYVKLNLLWKERRTAEITSNGIQLLASCPFNCELLAMVSLNLYAKGKCSLSYRYFALSCIQRGVCDLKGQTDGSNNVMTKCVALIAPQVHAQKVFTPGMQECSNSISQVIKTCVEWSSQSMCVTLCDMCMAAELTWFDALPAQILKFQKLNKHTSNNNCNPLYSDASRLIIPTFAVEVAEKMWEACRKRTSGNNWYQRGKYQLALECYQSGYKLLSKISEGKCLASYLHSNSAAAFSSLGNPQSGIRECAAGLSFDGDNLKCLFRKAKCHIRVAQLSLSSIEQQNSPRWELPQEGFPNKLAQLKSIVNRNCQLASDILTTLVEKLNKLDTSRESLLNTSRSTNDNGIPPRNIEWSFHVLHIQKQRNVASAQEVHRSMNELQQLVRKSAMLSKSSWAIPRTNHSTPRYSKEQGWWRASTLNGVYSNTSQNSRASSGRTKQQNSKKWLPKARGAATAHDKFHEPKQKFSANSPNKPFHPPNNNSAKKSYSDFNGGDKDRFKRQRPPAKTTSVQQDHYAVLGLSSTATRSEIRKAFHKQALKLHPDKAGNGNSASLKVFHMCSEAYQVLKDPQRKLSYDKLRRLLSS